MRKVAVPTRPSRVLTACSHPHFVINDRVLGPAFSFGVASSLLLVGKMAIKVKGQLKSMS
ncbi:MAG: hypothetical protein WDM89_02695 [Rhizomicrobium sp.]